MDGWGRHRSTFSLWIRIPLRSVSMFGSWGGGEGGGGRSVVLLPSHWIYYYLANRSAHYNNVRNSSRLHSFNGAHCVGGGIEADKLNGNDFTLSISLRPYKAASCRWRAQYPVYNTRRHQTTTIEIIKREHCLIYHRDFSAPKLLWLNRTTPNSIVY